MNSLEICKEVAESIQVIKSHVELTPKEAILLHEVGVLLLTQRILNQEKRT